jgi:hypothetical protein
MSVRAATNALAPERSETPSNRHQSCPAPALPVDPSEPAIGIPQRSRTFHLLVKDGDVASPSNYLATQAILRAVGKHVQVYVDADDLKTVGSDVLKDLVATFDEKIFPVASATIGRARDVDDDGRFTILMSSRLTGLGGARNAVDGYVRGADLDLKLDAPFSNRCDMMYLNAALTAGPYLRTILAHEYTHAVTYTAKLFNGPDGERLGAEEEAWLDEALAHLAEDLHGFSRANIAYRVSAFLSAPERYRLVVDDYFTAELFRSHGNRGGTYLFLRWCADQYGPGLLPTLVRSTKKGIENLEAATGERFADLYRRWSTELYLSGVDSTTDRGGYHSINLRTPLDGWELAGPRTTLVRPGQPAENWLAAGTSSHYVVVEPSPAGVVEVEVTAPPDAELQVTAMPLPADTARLELKVRVTTRLDGELSLRAEVSERGGPPVDPSALSWEALVPAANARMLGFQRGSLGRSDLAAVFGSETIGPGRALVSRPIQLTRIGPDSGPLIVKLVGRDQRGRRVAAWAEINRTPDDSDQPALEARLPR